MLLKDLPSIVLLPVCFHICSLIYFAWRLHLWKKYIYSLGQMVPCFSRQNRIKRIGSRIHFHRNVLQAVLKTVCFSIVKSYSLWIKGHYQQWVTYTDPLENEKGLCETQLWIAFGSLDYILWKANNFLIQVQFALESTLGQSHGEELFSWYMPTSCSCCGANINKYVGLMKK